MDKIQPVIPGDYQLVREKKITPMSEMQLTVRPRGQNFRGSGK
jgi:hypothetical protein